MWWLCAFLYVSGLPIAWHHTDNCFELNGKRPPIAGIVALVFCWPVTWFLAYLYSFLSVAWELARKQQD